VFSIDCVHEKKNIFIRLATIINKTTIIINKILFKFDRKKMINHELSNQRIKDPKKHMMHR
jgi:hypothetical protein